MDVSFAANAFSVKPLTIDGQSLRVFHVLFSHMNTWFLNEKQKNMPQLNYLLILCEKT